MQTRYLAAAVQMDSGTDKSANIDQAERSIREASAEGAALVVLPELFTYLGDLETLEKHADLPNGEALERMRSLAKELDLVLCTGSIAIKREDSPDQVANRSVLFGPLGQTLSSYDKIHCFDIHYGDIQVEESKFIAAGSTTSVSATSLGHIGQAICYDLRFPELFRKMSEDGMQVCCVPSAFTYRTGQAHWQILLRARAIENQAYVVAANQCGMYGKSVRCYGNSQIIDPWGEVLSSLGDDRPGIVYAEIDLERQRKIRRELPALEHRRLG